MLLVVDIGNTRTKLGLFEKLTYKKTAIEDLHRDAMETFIGTGSLKGVIVTSVVPSLTQRLIAIMKDITQVPPLLISHTFDTGLSFAVEHPERVGTDRIVAAAYCYQHFGGAMAVVDLGTVTTISIVDGSGAFLGGALIPGVDMMLGSLSQRTALLPQVQHHWLVELGTDIRAIGGDTQRAIASGVVIGSAGAIQRIINEAQTGLGYRLSIALTGGNCSLLASFLNRVDLIEPDLSLKALKYLYDRVNPTAGALA
ncbi:MAG: type III pantothenate kinase [Nitrospirae bacterium]|nr:type III pantothenate kinase [Nitrospirota bacterium]